MKIQKPYMIETEHYIQIYYGGACNPSKLQNQKRKKISQFTRQSQRRLLEKIETVINYKPNYIMRFYFNREIPILKSNLILNSFFISMKKYFENVVGRLPMVFWRKCFKDGEFWYECLIDFPSDDQISSITYFANMYWQLKIGKTGKVILENFSKENRAAAIKKFCLENFSGYENQYIGRYWGMIYKKYHRFKKIKKKIYSSYTIREKIKDLKQINYGNLKRYIYEKPN